MKYIAIVLSLGFIHGVANFLVWTPGGSKIQMIAGVGLPIMLQRETLILGVSFKAAYKLPTNASDLRGDPSTILLRKKRSRSDAYEIFGNFLEMYGLRGKSCVQKAICEAASSPLRGDGLLDEIFQVILTPSADEGNNEYLRAFNKGTRADCEYPECELRIYDTITKYIN